MVWIYTAEWTNVLVSAVKSVVTAWTINILLSPSSGYMIVPVFMKKEAETSKILVRFYQTTRCHVNLRSQRHKKLKSYLLRLGITPWNGRWNRWCVTGSLSWLLIFFVINRCDLPYQWQSVVTYEQQNGSKTVNYNKIYTTFSDCYMFRLLSHATIQQLKYIRKII